MSADHSLATPSPSSLNPIDETRVKIATACRILAMQGLVHGVLGHVSARTGEDGFLIRCRGPNEHGLGQTVADDVCQVDGKGVHRQDRAGWQVPKEVPIHASVYAARPGAGAVVHAHPPPALLCGLAGLTPRPVFGAYNIPAMRMALGGVPVYPRSVLISRPELAAEMLDVMGDRSVCLLAGHGITVIGPTVESATVAAVNLNELLSITVELARLGADPPNVPTADLAELPDLGSNFNDLLVWNALVAETADAGAPRPRG